MLKFLPEGPLRRGECSMQLALEESTSNANKYRTTGSHAKELNKAVACFIAKDAFPISTVRKPGFKHLVSKLNPRYEILSRKHFSEYEIPALYSFWSFDTVWSIGLFIGGVISSQMGGSSGLRRVGLSGQMGGSPGLRWVGSSGLRWVGSSGL